MQTYKLVIGRHKGPFKVFADSLLSDFNARGSVDMALDSATVKALLYAVLVQGEAAIDMHPEMDLPKIRMPLHGESAMGIDATLTFYMPLGDTDDVVLELGAEADDLAALRLRLLGEVDDLTFADVDDWTMYTFDWIMM